MTVPFETKGDRPEWEIVYDRLRRMSIGDLITYEELDELLGRDFRKARAPYNKAHVVLLENDKRAMDNVVGVGYRVIEPSKQDSLARRQHRSARRRLRSASRFVRQADRTRMSPDDAARMDRIEAALAEQEDMIRRIDRRTETHARAIASLTKDVDALKSAVQIDEPIV
jgi:uncharacterized coiled-coil protein SlyX